MVRHCPPQVITRAQGLLLTGVWPVVSGTTPWAIIRAWGLLLRWCTVLPIMGRCQRRGILIAGGAKGSQHCPHEPSSGGRVCQKAWGQTELTSPLAFSRRQGLLLRGRVGTGPRHAAKGQGLSILCGVSEA